MATAYVLVGGRLVQVKIASNGVRIIPSTKSEEFTNPIISDDQEVKQGNLR